MSEAFSSGYNTGVSVKSDDKIFFNHSCGNCQRCFFEVTDRGDLASKALVQNYLTAWFSETLGVTAPRFRLASGVILDRFQDLPSYLFDTRLRGRIRCGALKSPQPDSPSVEHLFSIAK
jgi:hypothetical protein